MIRIENINSFLVCMWLLLCSWQDIKNKKINVILIGMGFLVLLISTLILGNLTIWNRLAGLTLGIILLSLNPITKGQIGIGDGIIVCITGLCLGFPQNAILLAYALFGSAMFSIVLLVIRRVNRKRTIPFVPFLLIGYLGVLMLE